MSKCAHLNFRVDADINRITKGEGGPVEGYMADIRIKCTDCDLPFEFIGLDCGMLWDRPMVNPSAQVLRAPIKPKGLNLLPGLPGFTVRAQ